MSARDIMLDVGAGWLPRSKARAQNRVQEEKAVAELRQTLNSIRTAHEIYRYTDTERKALGIARCHIAKAIWQIQILINNGK